MGQRKSGKGEEMVAARKTLMGDKKKKVREDGNFPEWNNGMRAETTESMRRGAGKGEQTVKTWKRRREIGEDKDEKGKERVARKTWKGKRGQSAKKRRKDRQNPKGEEREGSILEMETEGG